MVGRAEPLPRGARGLPTLSLDPAARLSLSRRYEAEAPSLSLSRKVVWQLLLGYLPTNRQRRADALASKRRQYADDVARYFDCAPEARSQRDQAMLRQVLVDVPRTCPDVPLFAQEPIQRGLEHVLYVYGVRHAATGCVPAPSRPSRPSGRRRRAPPLFPFAGTCRA